MKSFEPIDPFVESESKLNERARRARVYHQQLLYKQLIALVNDGVIFNREQPDTVTIYVNGWFYIPKDNPVLLNKIIRKIKYIPHSAYFNAQYVIKGRWPEAERYIMKDPESAYFYAQHVIKGRWPEAERYIMKDPESAYWYAKYVIKGPWPEAGIE